MTTITQTLEGFVSDDSILLANKCTFESNEIARLAEAILYYSSDFNEWKERFSKVLNTLDIDSKWR
jgi:hypothetical protein